MSSARRQDRSPQASLAELSFTTALAIRTQDIADIKSTAILKYKAKKVKRKKGGLTKRKWGNGKTWRKRIFIPYYFQTRDPGCDHNWLEVD